MNWNVEKVVDILEYEAYQRGYDTTTDGRIFIFKCKDQDGLKKYMPEIVGTLGDDGYFEVKWSLTSRIDGSKIPYYDGFESIVSYMQDAAEFSTYLNEFDATNYSE